MAANPKIQRGILDEDLAFATAQAIPTDDALDFSEYCIDFGLVSPRLAQGARLKIRAIVTTAFGISAGAPTLTLGLCTDDNVTPSSDTDIIDDLVGPIPATAVAGDIYEGEIPAGAVAAFERYLFVTLTASTTQFTSGNIDIYLVPQ